METQSPQIVDAARGILKAYGYFVDNLWHIEDVHFICEQHNLPRLSDTDAMGVFMVANECFDGENGISWPQLERAVKIYLQRRKALGQLAEEKVG